MQKETKSSIFSRNINKKYKLIPFSSNINSAFKTKYFPPISKEWWNNIYSYNKNTIKNFPVLDTNIFIIIKNYFNLYFNNNFFNTRYKSSGKSYNKIFVSKPEIKHTNSKALITIYTYNKEGRSLLRKIKDLRKRFFRRFFKFNDYSLLYGELSSILIKPIKIYMFKQLKYIRRLKLKLNFNKYKFEEKFLYILSSLISRFYNKKVEFNIVNLRYLMLNTDIFTQILSSELKKSNSSPLAMINVFFNKTKIAKSDIYGERDRVFKYINMDIIRNKWKYININSIIVKNNLDNILKDIYHNLVFKSISNISSISYKNIYNTIFNSIAYKNTSGIRIDAKGRLTRRYRADRAIYKFKLKGGLKNIDSSHKGLSSINYRGFTSPNIQYSIKASKRRIGAFAVKGWISGK